MTTVDKLRQIFETYFDQQIADFGYATAPEHIEKWDSTAHVGLILEIERQFDIEFTPTELARLSSVGAIRQILQQKAVHTHNAEI